MEFSAPSTMEDSGFRAKDAVDHLLLIHPIEFREDMRTSYSKVGELSPAVVCNITDLDEDEEFDSVILWQVALVNALKTQIGSKVLARMTQGQAKPGQSAPYILADATQDAAAVKLATDYLTGVAKASLESPAAAPVAQVLDLSKLDPATLALLHKQLGAIPV
jgi:hypothetical protein